MNSSNLENNQNLLHKRKDDYEIINFKYWYNLILRNKFLVGSFTFITVTLVVLYSLTLKRVWQGQFQIVLNTNKQQKSQIDPLMALAGMTGIAKLSTQSTDLKTEVEILQSPSVLMPIFKYSLSLKNENNKDENFSDWKKKLDIELKEQTKVLEISYKDTNKKAIISVLNMMGEKYQEYSGKNTKRNNELTNNYLNNQILNFKKKSSESLKIAQEFASEQDLVFNDIYPYNPMDNKTSLEPQTNNQQAFSSLMNINLEKMRVEAATSIRVINLQLDKLKDLENTNDIQFIVSSIPFLVEQDLPNNLIEIDQELAMLRSKYTENSEPIKRALERRQLTIKFLKNRAIDFLKSSKSEAESRMEAAMRPKGVLLKYKELIREAYRDETTLVSLENQLRGFELESSRQSDPWELITRPTLLNSPVAPKKKEMTIFALIISLFISTLFAFYKEKKSGIIYIKDELKELLYPISPIFEINLEDPDEVNQNIIFLKNLLTSQSLKKIFFLCVGNIESNLLEKLKNSFIRANPNKELEFANLDQNLKLVNKNTVCYVISKLGSINTSDISFFKKNMELFDIPIKGLIILS